MGVNFINILIIFIFFLPLLSALFFGFNQIKRKSLWFLFEVGLLIVSLIALYLQGEQNLRMPISFMGEEITLSVSTTPILLFFEILLVLGIFIWRNSKIKSAEVSGFQLILINIALSLGFIAFISGQFMIRYMALDIVGLVAALTVIDLNSREHEFKDFVLIFQFLRLGDLSLLSSILLVNQGAFSLDISKMISFASEMPINSRIWVFAGFILAVWVKCAIWPFGIWLRRAQKATNEISFWISGFLMPVLGYYLLYRISPIINSHQTFRIILLIIGLLSILLMVVLARFQMETYDRFSFLSSISGSILLCAVAINPNLSLLSYLLGLIAYRLIIFLEGKSIIRIPKIIRMILPIAINAVFFLQNTFNSSLFIRMGWIGLTATWILGDWILENKERLGENRDFPFLKDLNNNGVWLSGSAEWLKKNIEQRVLSHAFGGNLLLKIAHWLNRTIEGGVFTDGIVNFGTFFQKFANFNREKVEQCLENSWTWVGEKVTSISQGTFTVFEIKAPEKTDEFVGEALKSVEAYEKNVLKKRMRWDLLWIPLLLIIILIFLVVV